MKVALVGATGLVGSVMLEVLEERNFQVSELIPVASAKSLGKSINFKGKKIAVVSAEQAVKANAEIALFSAGASTSKEWAPKFAQNGTTVIDNSSAWRMDPDIKLIVPEVNGDQLKATDKIIANPNCSTIQMVVALSPLHRTYGIERLVISTYQSFTGTGAKAVAQYQSESNGNPYSPDTAAYHYQIFENCIPHCDIFLDNRYTKEEMKLVNETRKILNSPNIRITATAVRVPVDGGHSESVNIEFAKPYEISEIYRLLNQSPGIIVQDNLDTFEYPMPLFAKGNDNVFVGRIRIDESISNGLNLWIVSDNLRKGAATNAIQIAEFIAAHGLIG